MPPDIQTPKLKTVFKNYLLSTWKETGSFERGIILTFLGLGGLFLTYMAYRLIYTCVAY